MRKAIAAAVMAVGVLVAVGACGVPGYRVRAVTAAPGGKIAVVCVVSGSSGPVRTVYLPAVKARSVHVNDLCPA